MTENANRAPSDMGNPHRDREEAVSALLSIDRAPDLARVVIDRLIGRRLRQLRDGALPPGEYWGFSGSVSHTSGGPNPPERPQWILRKALVVRYRLSEAADLHRLISHVAKMDAVGIRSPPCLAGFAFSYIRAMGWDLHEPDLSTWLCQAARQNAAPVPQSPECLFWR